MNTMITKFVDEIINKVIDDVTKEKLKIPEIDCCCICLEDLDNNINFTALQCSHKLHFTCLVELINHDQHSGNDDELGCPLCRRYIFTNEPAIIIEPTPEPEQSIESNEIIPIRLSLDSARLARNQRNIDRNLFDAIDLVIVNSARRARDQRNIDRNLFDMIDDLSDISDSMSDSELPPIPVQAELPTDVRSSILHVLDGAGWISNIQIKEMIRLLGANYSLSTIRNNITILIRQGSIIKTRNPHNPRTFNYRLR
tara:strand:- start:913 stop:1677 length:765 start_codon:yes stop_codon:yes gene_type:complete